MKVCVLAFTEPPSHWGFRLTRKSNAWFIRIAPERVPNCLAALKRLGITARAIWPAEDKPRPTPVIAKGKHGQKRPRGKARRAAYDKQRHDALDLRYIEQAAKTAEAIAATARMIAIKEARLKAEAEKRKAELASQRRHLLAREQAAEADRVHRLYLLNHPVGSA